LPKLLAAGFGGWLLGAKIHSGRATKKLKKVHQKEQKNLYTQYYNDVYKLQEKNAELQYTANYLKEQLEATQREYEEEKTQRDYDEFKVGSMLLQPLLLLLNSNLTWFLDLICRRRSHELTLVLLLLLFCPDELYFFSNPTWMAMIASVGRSSIFM
jgi:hypothetical protein